MTTAAVLAVTLLAILTSMGMLLVRALLGPGVFDRILAANSFGTKTVLLISVLNFISGRPEFLDLALVYALMNFIATIAVLRFSDQLSFVTAPPAEEPPGPD